jgi:hypothetical protein
VTKDRLKKDHQKIPAGELSESQEHGRKEEIMPLIVPNRDLLLLFTKERKSSIMIQVNFNLMQKKESSMTRRGGSATTKSSKSISIALNKLQKELDYSINYPLCLKGMIFAASELSSWIQL